MNSVGSKGDSYDNALAETIIGLYKTELVRRRGPWKGLDDVDTRRSSGWTGSTTGVSSSRSGASRPQSSRPPTGARRAPRNVRHSETRASGKPGAVQARSSTPWCVSVRECPCGGSVLPGEPLPRRLLRYLKRLADLSPCAALPRSVLDCLADQLVDGARSTTCNPEILKRLLPPRSDQSKTTLRRLRMERDRFRPNEMASIGLTEGHDPGAGDDDGLCEERTGHVAFRLGHDLSDRDGQVEFATNPLVRAGA